MMIRFEMSGGYGGLFTAVPLSLSVSSDDLPPAEREELHRLIAESGLLDAGDTSPPGPDTPVRDAFHYRIDIVEGGETHTHQFDDTTAPVEARPLLDHLKSAAISQRTGEV